MINRSSDDNALSAYDRAVLASFPLNDIGNSRRFAHLFGDRFRFCPETDWLEYDEGRWRKTTFDHVLKAAIYVVECIGDERNALSHDRHDEHRKWEIRSKAFTSMERLIKCARATLLVDGTQLDQQPNRLNLGNGTLIVSPEGTAYQLRAHNPHDLMTKRSEVCFSKGIDAPLWRQHLEQGLPNPDVRAYVQRVLGSCLMGRPRENAFWVFLGKGGDGKTTTLNVIRHVLGEYAQALNVKVLVNPAFQDGGDSASPQLAALAGDIRLVLISEPPPGARLNESLVKQLTGGSSVSVRRLHKPPFEFLPNFKMIMEANSLPEIIGEDEGIWRRVRVVPWEVQIPASKMDLNIEAKLKREASGILNWLLEGMISYAREGLNEPAEVRSAIARYRGAPQDVQDWAAERLEFGANKASDQLTLYKDCVAWLRVRRHVGIRREAFTKFLSALGIRRDGLHGVTRRVMYSGAALKEVSSN